MVLEVGGKLHVEFFGCPFEDNNYELLDILSGPSVAARLAFLSLRGPDEGANGTRSWGISQLLETTHGFPNLLTFTIEQTQPGHHNRTVVGEDYYEEGTIAALLEKSPLLREMTVPSAPNERFFRLGTRPLRFLNVDAGYDAQDSIRNLSTSTCFPQLMCLEFGEYNETYIDDFETHCTHFDDYPALFSSDAFEPVKRFVWRNPACSDEQIARLNAIRSRLQLLVVRTRASYVR